MLSPNEPTPANARASTAAVLLVSGCWEHAA